MPGFNQNGPAGQGPMSGRGMGVCGNGTGTMMGRGGRGGWCRNGGMGRRMAGGSGAGISAGMGAGMGRGLGAGQFGGQQPVAAEDKNALQAAYEAAQRDLAQLKQRLDALEKSGEPEVE